MDYRIDHEKDLSGNKPIAGRDQKPRFRFGRWSTAGNQASFTPRNFPDDDSNGTRCGGSIVP